MRDPFAQPSGIATALLIADFRNDSDTPIISTDNLLYSAKQAILSVHVTIGETRDPSDIPCCWRFPGYHQQPVLLLAFPCRPCF